MLRVDRPVSLGSAKVNLLTRNEDRGGRGLPQVGRSPFSFYLNSVTVHFSIYSGLFLEAFQKMGFSGVIKVKGDLLFVCACF